MCGKIFYIAKIIHKLSVFPQIMPNVFPGK